MNKKPPPPSQEEKNNLLLLAGESGNINALKSAIKSGANPKFCSHQVLIWALYNDKTKIIKELIKHYNYNELKEIIKKRFDNPLSQTYIRIVKELKSSQINQHISKLNKKTLEL